MFFLGRNGHLILHLELRSIPIQVNRGIVLQVYEAVVVDHVAVLNILLSVCVVHFKLSQKLLGHLAGH
jgi:hypothetical protein